MIVGKLTKGKDDIRPTCGHIGEIVRLTTLDIGQCHMHDYTTWAHRRFHFNSQAKSRKGGHVKEKIDILVSLSLANQTIMVDDKGSHFKAMFPGIFADYQNPPLTADVAMANKTWQIWQNTPVSWW